MLCYWHAKMSCRSYDGYASASVVPEAAWEPRIHAVTSLLPRRRLADSFARLTRLSNVSVEAPGDLPGDYVISVTISSASKWRPANVVARSLGTTAMPSAHWTHQPRKSIEYHKC